MTTLSPPPQLPGEQIRLLNAIVDVCLVYGFDETCQCDLVIGEGDSEVSCVLCLPNLGNNSCALWSLTSKGIAFYPNQLFPPEPTMYDSYFGRSSCT